MDLVVLRRSRVSEKPPTHLHVHLVEILKKFGGDSEHLQTFRATGSKCSSLA